MKYGLIGEKLGHSFSKEIHEMLGCEYELKEIPQDCLEKFFKDRQFDGINVTIPYKRTVIPFLDEISDGAREIGAVNTVVNRGGRLCGYNTDIDGLEALIMRITGGRPPSGKVLVLGSGGTSLTASAAAKNCGAAQVLRVSRSAEEKGGGCISYSDAENRHCDAELIINCTPNGMFPHGDDRLLLDLEKYKGLKGVADCVYNPLRTGLVRKAHELGISAEGGLYMLTAQAVRANEYFFDRQLRPSQRREKCDEIYGRLMCGKENIVLTGMPSCGKTTVGKKLAKTMGRRFFDTDDEIVKREKREIADIFAQDGEEYFRVLESKVISELSQESGIVIATGGGAVLRHENVDALRSNGKIFFINRSVWKLMPTTDRPLASSKDAILKRFKERYGIYTGTADVIIDGNDAPNKVADRIEVMFSGKKTQDKV